MKCFALVLVLSMIAASANSAIISMFGNNNASVILNGTTNRAIAAASAGVSVTNNIGGGLAITNQFGTPSSGSGLVYPVFDHDYVGYTFSFTGSTNTFLQVYPSTDGSNTFNPTALFSVGGNGANTFYTNGYWDCHGLTHLGFQIVTTGTIDATNLLLEINPKNNLIETKLHN